MAKITEPVTRPVTGPAALQVGDGPYIPGAPSAPVIFLLDTMTGLVGTNLTAHAPDIGVTNWSAVSGTWLLDGVGGSYFSTNGLYTNPPTAPTADYEIEFDIDCLSVIGTQNIGIAGRTTAANSLYLMRYDRAAQTWALIALTPSGNTTLGSFADTFALGQSRNGKLRMQGNQISALITGVGAITPVTNSGVTAAGGIGLRGSNSPGTATTGYHVSRVVATTLT